MSTDSAQTPSMSCPMSCVYTTPPSILRKPPSFPDSAVSIFVGNSHSAGMVDCLEANNIQGVLNVAYDADDQPAAHESREYSLELLPDPYRPLPPPPQGSKQPLLRYKVQFAKVGLIDGYGNIPNHMAVIAAVYMADQLFTFPYGGDKVCPPLVNQYQRGNMLIHCICGGSRSVTVAALYIWYKFGVELKDPSLKSFSDVYNKVKSLRGDSTQPITSQGCYPCVPENTSNLTVTPPMCGMQEAAFAIVDTYATLFPAMTFK